MLTVAIDTGPLYGPATGVARAVRGVLDAFRQQESMIDVVPYVVSGRAELIPGTRRLPYPAFVAMKVWSRLDHPRVDRHLAPAHIVHGMNYVVPPARIPRVVSVYDTWALRNPHACSPVVNRAMAVLRRNIDSGAIVHASSHATALAVQELFPRTAVHVAHLGSPSRTRSAHGGATSRTATIQGLLGHDGPYLLSVGTLERRKNYPRLISAFSTTQAAKSGVRLVIVGGDGDDVEEITSTIDGLDPTVRNQIVLFGRASDLQLDALYDHAEMVAYVSLDEGFGFPILEAMSHEAPVLGSNRGAIPEIGGDAVVQVDPTDCDAIASQIDNLMTDLELRTFLIQSGIKRCDQFPWSRTADSLIDLYRSLLPDETKPH